MTGELAILNVSAGDTKLTFDPKKPEETKRACAVVTDMLRRGFAVMVEVGSNDRGPLYQRVKEFDAETAEYIIVGVPDDQQEPTHGKEQQASPAPRRRKGKASTTVRLPASRTKAVAVAPTSGG